jgi:hypothetical protein
LDLLQTWTPYDLATYLYTHKNLTLTTVEFLQRFGFDGMVLAQFVQAESSVGDLWDNTVTATTASGGWSPLEEFLREQVGVTDLEDIEKMELLMVEVRSRSEV